MNIKQRRPIQHPDLTGADADAQATEMVADMFVSLRACPRTHRHSSATTERDRQKVPCLPEKKIFCQAMSHTGEVDLHSDSGYRRLSGDADDDVKGY
eukprot:6042217-Pyramimonas_sp.AAC.1